MTADELLDQLSQQQQSLLNIIRQAGEEEYRTQYHIDLSPLGWHLGHCVFTEIYWLREVLLGETPKNTSLKSFYVPELSPKKQRGSGLPPKTELCRWADKTQLKHRGILQQLMERKFNHELMDNFFLVHFLIHHYAQHNETMHYILTQRALQKPNYFKVERPLLSDQTTLEKLTINENNYYVGSADELFSYDNERPAQLVNQQEFHISRYPVTNSDYLAFMQAGGYETEQLWSKSGWKWKSNNSVNCPDHWLQDPAGNWFGHNVKGPVDLEAEAPVYGVSYYEAAAYACWAGARLAHEQEWEIACRMDKLSGIGQVWEWCSNAFFPYAGFQAYPYDGYSVPYFDHKHFTLKGGSRYTQSVIKRPSFRNYYEADKRHHYAGIRLAWG